MTGYINRIISRHTTPGSNIISPRLPGLFEQQDASAPLLPEETSIAPLPVQQSDAHPLEKKGNYPGKEKATNSNDPSEKSSKAATYIQADDKLSKEIFHDEMRAENNETPSLLVTGKQLADITPPVNDINPVLTGQYNKQENGRTGVSDHNMPADHFDDHPVTRDEQRAFEEKYLLTDDETITAAELSSFIHGVQENGNDEQQTISARKRKNLAPISPRVQPVAGGETGAAVPVANETGTSSTIKITIGRVEVKAITAQDTGKPAKRSVPLPKISLQEYLTSRNKADR